MVGVKFQEYLWAQVGTARHCWAPGTHKHCTNRHQTLVGARGHWWAAAHSCGQQAQVTCINTNKSTERQDNSWRCSRSRSHTEAHQQKVGGNPLIFRMPAKKGPSWPPDRGQSRARSEGCFSFPPPMSDFMPLYRVSPHPLSLFFCPNSPQCRPSFIWRVTHPYAGLCIPFLPQLSFWRCGSQMCTQ